MPISLVISLSQTLKGLHWDKVPGDNDDEVAARGILYLLIFQQLGQLVRWSWGYHVLLAPPETYEEEDAHTRSVLEQGRYRDEPEEEEGSDDTNVDDDDQTLRRNATNGSYEFESGEQTPMNRRKFSYSPSSKASSKQQHRQDHSGTAPELMPTPANGNIKPRNDNEDHITLFPNMRSVTSPPEGDVPSGVRGIFVRFKRFLQSCIATVFDFLSGIAKSSFHSLPQPVQKSLSMAYRYSIRFLRGLWDFMNPPLWAMLAAVIVASVPALQELFFSDGSFISNSATRAISQSGGVAVPLILVVLGANLARNTLPDNSDSMGDDKDDKKLLIACLMSRMLLPTIIMAPLLALAAKYVPVSILDDPIFVIVCFLLTGAPSALQLAQICQINGVYMKVMSKLLFQSYVIWYVVFHYVREAGLNANTLQDPSVYAHSCHACLGGCGMGTGLT